ncbi:hypothetical protein FALBO_738 [Fusarium albosuccineum]|uniref:BZIP domain-containing protein n=1 Tax=Fusarium albosuccineum TaxID=1237068 RepID=A0A8H4LMY6_9HYPO|nr:hypothetical protein FALBO_738 [Fusarium albosuccineum]
MSCQESLVSKWSSRPKDHNATRVRNNQRRHRARIKARIETLEETLNETQQELLEAKVRIRELESQLASQQAVDQSVLFSSTPSAPSGLEITQRTLAGQGHDLHDQETQKHSCCLRPSVQPKNPDGAAEQDHCPQDAGKRPHPGAEITSTIFATSANQSMASSSSTNQALAEITFSLLTQYNNDSHLPPVAPGESTTPCQVAFQIIAQQHTSGVEACDVEQWLRPGFRCATKPGEGCRVDTRVLYALIDYISPL